VDEEEIACEKGNGQSGSGGQRVGLERSREPILPALPRAEYISWAECPNLGTKSCDSPGLDGSAARLAATAAMLYSTAAH
jgi:hypothetical protein